MNNRTTPQVILQDFHAKILALNLATVFTTAAQWLRDDRHRQRRRAYRVSFANALSKMKNNIVRIFLYTSPGELCWGLIQKMASSVEAIRPDRSYPRNFKGGKSAGFLSELQAVAVSYGLS